MGICLTNISRSKTKTRMKKNALLTTNVINYLNKNGIDATVYYNGVRQSQSRDPRKYLKNSKKNRKK